MPILIAFSPAQAWTQAWTQTRVQAKAAAIVRTRNDFMMSSPSKVFCLLPVAPRNLRRVGIVDNVGMQLDKPHDVLVTWPAPEPALGGNAELRKMLFGRADAAASAL